MTDSQIEDRFLNFPAETLAAIKLYQTTHEPSLVRPIVRGILARYLPEHLRAQAHEAAKSLNAFGLESLTLMEVILDIQDALGLTLSDAELRSLNNLDEATAILSQKVADLSEEAAE